MITQGLSHFYKSDVEIMTIQKDVSGHLVRWVALFFFVSSFAHAQRGLPSQLDERPYTAMQQAYAASLQARVEEGNRHFLAGREVKLAAVKASGTSTADTVGRSSSAPPGINTGSVSTVLVSFPVRLTATKVNQYAKGLDAIVLELHRSVGDDQTSVGVSSAFDTPSAEAERSGEFLAYLKQREAQMQSEVKRTTSGSNPRLSAEFNLRAVMLARETIASTGMSFDGVLIRLPDKRLSEVLHLPDGPTALLAEFQFGGRRYFAVPLDVLRASKSRDY